MRIQDGQDDRRRHANYFLQLARHTEALIVGFSAEGLLTYSSPSLEQRLGWGFDELEGRHLSDLTHAEDAEEEQVLRSTAMSGSPRTLDLRMRTRAGRWRWLRGSACVVDQEDGEPAQLLALFHDVTDQKALEARLVTSGRAAAVGALAAGIAHEVNNPLSFIMGNLEYLGANVHGLKEGEALELFEEVLPDMLSGAKRIGGVMRDLRALTIATTPRTGAVNMRQLLELTVRMLQHTRRGHLPILTELEDVPLIQADEGHIVQVVLILLDNALAAIERSAREMPLIYLRLRMAGTMLLIEVEDQGPGISEASSEASSMSGGQQAGSGGRGLAISRYVVGQLKGELVLKGTPGEGTRAQVWLPVRQPSRLWHETPATPTPEQRGPAQRVLVIDNEAAMGRMLPRLLREPWHVRWCRSAEEALVILETGVEVDMILCDLGLSGMTGEQLHAAICARWPSMERRMGFLSGGAPSRDSESFLLQISDRFIAKPFERGVLLDLLNRLGQRDQDKT
jgi:PAS domain S-box-containing protein